MLLCKKTCKHIEIITWSQLDYPTFIKQSIVCTKQDQNHQQTEQSIQRSCMRRINIYQVYCSFNRQLGMSTMEVSLQAWNESQWTVLLGYPSVSKMLATIKHTIAILFLGKWHIIALCTQHSPTATAKKIQFYCS